MLWHIAFGFEGQERHPTCIGLPCILYPFHNCGLPPVAIMVALSTPHYAPPPKE